MNTNIHKLAHLLFVFFALIGLNSCIKSIQTAEVVEVSSPSTEDLNDVLFISDSIGFICGGTKYDRGIVLKTSDAGYTWLLDTLRAPKAFYDLEHKGNKLYATGNEGFFYVSNDNAKSWIEPGYPSWKRFNQMAFNDIGECFVAIGEGFDKGEIMFSSNDGASWSRVDTFNRTMKSIVFHNGRGFAGAYGLLYKSIDLGHTWIATDAASDFYNQIVFTSDSVGYAIGYFGIVLKTINGGESWTRILNEHFSFSEKSNFRDAYFVDDNNGYIVGDNGYVVYTNDGGKKWNAIQKFTDTDLYAIDKSGNNLYIAGATGKIYRMLLH